MQPGSLVSDAATQLLKVKDLGQVDYESVWQRMIEFTNNRQPDTPDELWLVEHPPVFTLGQAGKAMHVLAPGDIPLVKSDRGGQVTYHGPGQLVAYLLFNIRRKQINVRELVSGIEQSIIHLLANVGVSAELKSGAPGVYVEGEKIAALGLRIRRGCSYHGLSLNIDMDLEPFERINPCGYEGLKVTQLKDLGVNESFAAVTRNLVNEIARTFRYDYDDKFTITHPSDSQ